MGIGVKKNYFEWEDRKLFKVYGGGLKILHVPLVCLHGILLIKAF